MSSSETTEKQNIDQNEVVSKNSAITVTISRSSVEPWKPSEATRRIREAACSKDLKLHWTNAVRVKLNEIELQMGDALYAMKNGFVLRPGAPSSRGCLFKYAIEASTPNSNNRTVRVVVIPSANKHELKIVDVMWADEPIIKS